MRIDTNQREPKSHTEQGISAKDQLALLAVTAFTRQRSLFDPSSAHDAKPLVNASFCGFFVVTVSGWGALGRGGGAKTTRHEVRGVGDGVEDLLDSGCEDAPARQKFEEAGPHREGVL